MRGSTKKSIEYKVCSVCGKKKRLTSRNYYKQKSSPDGYQNQCKVCAQDYQKRYYDIQKKRLEHYEEVIIKLAYEQSLSEHRIGKLLDLPPSKVWDIIVKERSRRKKEALRKIKENNITTRRI